MRPEDVRPDVEGRLGVFGGKSVSFFTALFAKPPGCEDVLTRMAFEVR
ncbi:hypothetical protein [Prosthecobacter fluviatilis]|uniref:Uncharacterized protein n=1 Tax=Prosthecobacter fluviatilis TaxID=445931 RepID=A0ABW0KXU7_9BACT